MTQNLAGLGGGEEDSVGANTYRGIYPSRCRQLTRDWSHNIMFTNKFDSTTLYDPTLEVQPSSATIRPPQSSLNPIDPRTQVPGDFQGEKEGCPTSYHYCYRNSMDFAATTIQRYLPGPRCRAWDHHSGAGTSGDITEHPKSESSSHPVQQDFAISTVNRHCFCLPSLLAKTQRLSSRLFWAAPAVALETRG